MTAHWLRTYLLGRLKLLDISASFNVKINIIYVLRYANLTSYILSLNHNYHKVNNEYLITNLVMIDPAELL